MNPILICREVANILISYTLDVSLDKGHKLNGNQLEIFNPHENLMRQ